MRDIVSKKYRKHKETAHNFFWRALQVGSKQGTTFLIFFIAAYYLTPEKLGLFSYLMAIIGLLLIVCDFGFSPSTSKFVAELKTKKSPSLNNVLFSISSVIIVIASIVSISLILFGRFIFEEYELLLYLLPYLFFLPLSSVADGVYRGVKDFKKLSVISVAVALISIPASFLIIKSYGLVGAIISQNLVFGLLTVGLFAFRKDAQFKFDFQVTRKILKYAFVIGLGSAGYFLYTRVDILILKQFGFISEIGYYEIADKMIKLIIIPFMLLGEVIAPNITRLNVEEKYKLIRKKYTKYFFLFSFIGILLAVFLFFIYPVFLELFLKKYAEEEAVLIFRWLIIILPTYVVARVLSHGFLIASGNAKYNLVMIPIGFLNILLNYFFIYVYGFIGVVYATIICMSLNRFIVLVLLYRKIRCKELKNEKV